MKNIKYFIIFGYAENSKIEELLVSEKLKITTKDEVQDICDKLKNVYNCTNLRISQIDIIPEIPNFINTLNLKK